MPLRDSLTNMDILNAIRADARVDYQRVVPDATKGNIRETMETIFEHDWTRNQFVDALFNQIGSTVVRDITWKNPLAIFKQGFLNFGDTIQEVHADFIKGTLYSADRDYLEQDIFGQARGPMYSAFHTINRQEKFKITVNSDILRRAMLSPTGLQEMLSTILSVPASSDEWSEFLAMTSLFREYESTHGFFRVKIPDMNVLTSNKNDTDAALKAMRIYADKMQYPTPAFNAQCVHSFARPENLVLIATPEFKANVDVTSLSAAFNRADAEAPSQIITVPNEALGLRDISAILTTREFLVIKDTLLANRSVSNPAGLYDNYFLHHHEILSCSPFTPAIAFGTKENTNIVVPTPTQNEITAINPKNKQGLTTGVAAPGDVRELTYTLKTALPETVVPAVDWDVSGQKTDETRIDNDGVLVVGKREPIGTTLTVKLTIDLPNAQNVKPLTRTATISVK